MERPSSAKARMTRDRPDEAPADATPPLEAHVSKVHYMPRFKSNAVVLNTRPQSAGPAMMTGQGAAPRPPLGMPGAGVRAPYKRCVSRTPDAYPSLFVAGMSVQKQLETQYAELQARCKVLADENMRLREMKDSAAQSQQMHHQRAELLRIQEAAIMSERDQRDQLQLELQDARETMRVLQHELDQLQKSAAQPLPPTAKSTVTNAVNEAVAEISGLLGSRAPSPRSAQAAYSRVVVALQAAEAEAAAMCHALETVKWEGMLDGHSMAVPPAVEIEHAPEAADAAERTAEVTAQLAALDRCGEAVNEAAAAISKLDRPAFKTMLKGLTKATGQVTKVWRREWVGGSSEPLQFQR